MRPTSQASSSSADAFAAALARMQEPLGLVERAMREQLGSSSALVGALGDHVLGSGGKRMRPALLLVASELCGYTGPRRIHVAAAVELLHTATLLHDDVVDFSVLRRGRPSVNALWGMSPSLSAWSTFCTEGQLSHTSPSPSPSASAWSAL